MSGYDVTVTAVFEPIVYPITYELDGGKDSGSRDNDGVRSGEAYEDFLRTITGRSRRDAWRCKRIRRLWIDHKKRCTE